MASGAVSISQIELVRAAKIGDLAEIKRCLAWGLDIDAIAPNSLTALGAAAREGQVQSIRLLLARGAEVDALDDDKWTPLHGAAVGGCPEAIYALVDGGARIDALTLTSTMESPLHLALCGKRIANALALIRAGAAVDLPNGRGDLPLSLAAQAGLGQACEELMARGADPRRAAGEGKRTPLADAAGHGWMRCVSVLIAAGAKVDARDSDGATPLWLAAREGHSDACRLLIEAGANAGRAVSADCSPEGAARSQGHGDLADWLSCVAMAQSERAALRRAARTRAAVKSPSRL